MMHIHGPAANASHDLQDTHSHSHVGYTPSAPEDTVLPLSELPVGSWCTVACVLGEGALRRRLLDMGLTPRTRVLLRKTAPLGDPIEIHLRGYDLSLRRGDAASILVNPEEERK